MLQHMIFVIVALYIYLVHEPTLRNSGCGADLCTSKNPGEWKDKLLKLDEEGESLVSEWSTPEADDKVLKCFSDSKEQDVYMKDHLSSIFFKLILMHTFCFVVLLAYDFMMKMCKWQHWH